MSRDGIRGAVGLFVGALLGLAIWALLFLAGWGLYRLFR